MNAAAVRVVHAAVPGRARVHVPALKRGAEPGARLCARLTGEAGARRAECNPLTGNVLVEWDPEIVSLEDLVSEIAAWTGAPAADLPAGDPDAPDRDTWSRDLGAIVRRIPAYLKLGWALARDGEIPAPSKLGLMGGMMYQLLPVDLVPGFIPIWGQLDDLAILLHGLRATLRRCPPERAEPLLRRYGLSMEQLDQDLSAIGGIARGFGRAVGRTVTRGARKVFSHSHLRAATHDEHR